MYGLWKRTSQSLDSQREISFGDFSSVGQGQETKIVLELTRVLSLFDVDELENVWTKRKSVRRRESFSVCTFGQRKFAEDSSQFVRVGLVRLGEHKNFAAGDFTLDEMFRGAGHFSRQEKKIWKKNFFASNRKNKKENLVFVNLSIWSSDEDLKKKENRSSVRDEINEFYSSVATTFPCSNSKRKLCSTGFVRPTFSPRVPSLVEFWPSDFSDEEAFRELAATDNRDEFSPCPGKGNLSFEIGVRMKLDLSTLDENKRSEVSFTRWSRNEPTEEMCSSSRFVVDREWKSRRFVSLSRVRSIDFTLSSSRQRPERSMIVSLFTFLVESLSIEPICSSTDRRNSSTLFELRKLPEENPIWLFSSIRIEFTRQIEVDQNEVPLKTNFSVPRPFLLGNQKRIFLLDQRMKFGRGLKRKTDEVRPENEEFCSTFSRSNSLFAWLGWITFLFELDGDLFSRCWGGALLASINERRTLLDDDRLVKFSVFDFFGSFLFWVELRLSSWPTSKRETISSKDEQNSNLYRSTRFVDFCPENDRRISQKICFSQRTLFERAVFLRAESVAFFGSRATLLAIEAFDGAGEIVFQRTSKANFVEPKLTRSFFCSNLILRVFANHFRLNLRVEESSSDDFVFVENDFSQNLKRKLFFVEKSFFWTRRIETWAMEHAPRSVMKFDDKFSERSVRLYRSA